jgi:hypothetical protein
MQSTSCVLHPIPTSHILYPTSYSHILHPTSYIQFPHPTTYFRFRSQHVHAISSTFTTRSVSGRIQRVTTCCPLLALCPQLGVQIMECLVPMLLSRINFSLTSSYSLYFHYLSSTRIRTHAPLSEVLISLWFSGLAAGDRFPQDAAQRGD